MYVSEVYKLVFKMDMWTSENKGQDPILKKQQQQQQQQQRQRQAWLKVLRLLKCLQLCNFIMTFQQAKIV